MKKRPVELHTTPDGLRMVHIHVPGSAVGYCGVAVRVGSRDDGDGRHGLAHFVEHTIFKGTAKRSSWHIINRMEAVGGELNAFTTKEETVVFSAFPAGNLTRAAELIADLITSSRFPEKELEKEREVVADEIDSYLDSPAEAVFDDFEDLMFAGSSLGHNILGTRRALRTFTSEVCRDYLARWYVRSNMVVFYAGNQSAKQVFATLERTFNPDILHDGASAECVRPVPAPVVAFNEVRSIRSRLCHTVAGARIGSIMSPHRYVTSLLGNILGGPGMNSLLNVELRERRGLVYSVEATSAVYSDCGALAIYYGCDPENSDLCHRLIENTISSVADGYITPRRLEAAKKQYLGQLTMASENMENQILSAARQTLMTGRPLKREEVTEGLLCVSADDIRECAAALLPLSTITLGTK